MMNARSTFFLFISLMAVSILFSQCQSSKIAYGNKYYFKQTPRTEKPVVPVAARPEAPEQVLPQGLAQEPMVTASVERPIVKQQSTKQRMLEAKAQVEASLDAGEKAMLKQRAEQIQNLAMSAKDKQLDRKERRAFRKEMKKEMKALARDFNSITESQETNFLDDLDENLRKAIIFWAIGLAISVVATFVPFIWILASISYLVGTIFFILWLVEELD